MRFVANGLPFGRGGVNAHEQYVSARTDAGIERGFDLYYVIAERRFRIEEYRAGEKIETHYLHETRVEDYKPW
jgi:hypothetical protein